ncbi:MAG: DUF4307 domain-containing protein [Angustibacter sp.]
MTSPSAAQPLQLPPGRYSRPASRRRRAILAVVAGLALVGALAWVVWAGLHQARADVRWSDVGFVIVGDTAVQVTYDVGKDPGATAVCSLRALDVHKTAVGVAEVTVGPTDRRVTRRTDTVRTSAQAVTGTVRECVVRP